VRPFYKTVLRIQGRDSLVSVCGSSRQKIEVDFEGEITFFHIDLYFLRILFPLLISEYKFRIEGEYGDVSDEEKRGAQSLIRQVLLPKVKKEVMAYFVGKKVLAPILIGG